MFTVEKIVPHSYGLYAFMDIDSMRSLFEQNENYYNVVLADQPLDIDSDMLYGIISREDIKKTANIFMQQMKPMIICLEIISVIMFVMVMYLMIKVMIDRSAFSISLIKIFGFRQREIRKLFLQSNFIMILIAAAICIPLAKAAIDELYPYLIANVACGMDLSFPFPIYLCIYAGIVLCYFIINQILAERLKKVIPAEVLKNRE